MGRISTPALGIANIEWQLDRPGQANTSPWTGKRTSSLNPWHGKWYGRVQLAPMVTEANVRSTRSFLARCRGVGSVFRLVAVEGPQNANSGVIVASSAAAGATSIRISGAATALVDGQLITVNDQLLQLTADQDSSGSLYFEPPLREAANAGTSVETSRPYALVYMTSSRLGWSVNPGQVYGASFEVEEAVGEPDAAGASLSLEFDAQRYWVAGKRKSLLSSVSGYAFSRSGQQGAVAADGSVTFFAANTPAIDSNGFHCYDTVTNGLLQSQTFDNASWVKTGGTIIANALAGPDGTMTADLFNEDSANSSHLLSQFVGGYSAGAGQLCTLNIIIKSVARRWVLLSASNVGAPASCQAWFDIQNGVVGTRGAGATSASIAALANGFYRCTITFATAAAGAVNCNIAGASADGVSSAYTGLGGNAFIVWHGSLLNGAFASGGPTIVTTTAAATIGASDLELAASLPSGDFIAWAAINMAAGLASVAFDYSTPGAGSPNDHLGAQITSSGNLRLLAVAGGVTQPTPADIASVIGASLTRAVVLIRRRNGIYSMACKKNDGSIVIAADAAGTGAIPTVSAVEIGSLFGGTQPLGGRIEGFYQRNGTFSDADVAAILTDA